MPPRSRESLLILALGIVTLAMALCTLSIGVIVSFSLDRSVRAFVPPTVLTVEGTPAPTRPPSAPLEVTPLSVPLVTRTPIPTTTPPSLEFQEPAPTIPSEFPQATATPEGPAFPPTIPVASPTLPPAPPTLPAPSPTEAVALSPTATSTGVAPPSPTATVEEAYPAVPTPTEEAYPAVPTNTPYP